MAITNWYASKSRGSICLTNIGRKSEHYWPLPNPVKMNVDLKYLLSTCLRLFMHTIAT